MERGDLQLWLVTALLIALGVALLVRTIRGAARPLPSPVARTVRGRGTEQSRPPRAQHYRFAHVLLRDIALADVATTWDAITDPGGRELLVDLWRSAKPKSDDAISPEGLRVEVDGEIAIVTLPPPARRTEAYMIALVRSPAAYFVLEKGERSAYLAEWRREMRVRFGDVPTPAKRALVTEVRALLAERNGVPAVEPSVVDASPLVCCPYCISPITDPRATCPTCGRDCSKDAPVEYEVDTYADAPRNPCATCGHAVIEIATTCPSCRTRPFASPT